MPKLKTHKTAAGRFKVTGTGKILRPKVGRSHLRRNKPKRVKRVYDEMMPVNKRDVPRIRKLIPYA